MITMYKDLTHIGSFEPKSDAVCGLTLYAISDPFPETVVQAS